MLDFIHNNFVKDFKKNTFLIITGAVCGAVNGFFGGGGGMIVVPMLCKLLKYETKVAHATALAIILPVSIVSGITYIINKQFDFSIGISVTIGALIGGIAGALLLKKLSAKWVAKIFAVVMLIAGGKLLLF